MGMRYSKKGAIFAGRRLNGFGRAGQIPTDNAFRFRFCRVLRRTDMRTTQTPWAAIVGSGLLILAAAYALSQQAPSLHDGSAADKPAGKAGTAENVMSNQVTKVTKSDAEWKKELTPEQYH